jgi:hypothetical protein
LNIFLNLKQTKNNRIKACNTAAFRKKYLKIRLVQEEVEELIGVVVVLVDNKPLLKMKLSCICGFLRRGII